MSIRTVQTSFTSSAPSTSSLESSWDPSSTPSSRVLADIDMNYPRPSQIHHAAKKFPPGLGYYSMPTATESSPSLVLSPPHPRRRSGSFNYGPIGDNNHSSSSAIDLSTLTSPVAFVPSPPKRRNFTRLASSHYRPAPSNPPFVPSQVVKSSGEYSRYSSPSGPIKFDPFGSDDSLVTPTPLSNTYNHYWQYNSTTNSPVMMYNSNNNINSNDRKTSPASSIPSSSLTYNIKLAASSSTVSLPSTLPSSTPIQISLPLPKPDKNARSKLVAGILLNRIYAVGKPMKKRLPFGMGKEYVKSNLSQVTTVEF